MLGGPIPRDEMSGWYGTAPACHLLWKGSMQKAPPTTAHREVVKVQSPAKLCSEGDALAEKSVEPNNTLGRGLAVGLVPPKLGICVASITRSIWPPGRATLFQ